MYSAMKKLIEKRFYNTEAEAQNKLDVFFAVNRLSDGEYAELTVLTAEVYAA